ncbi:MAG: hypothetical protein OXI84_02250 [bacterium]|nr:hypothetical protein [bacterium]
MTLRDRSLLTEILAPEERAIESVVGRYQRVAGAVTRVARTVAGREELRVTLGSTSRASEHEVVIDPGLFQAAYGRRAPVTAEETALASALHEVIHLVSSDFDECRPIPDHWLQDDRPGPKEGEEFTLLEALDRAGGPPAEALFFALEDARQERQGLEAYPGARSVLEDLYRSSLRGALAGRGPLARYTIACFMSVGGYAPPDRLERLLDSRSGPAWADSRAVLNEASVAAQPWDTGDLTMQLLAIAKAHGLIQQSAPDDQPVARREREQAEKDAMTDGLDRVRLFSPAVQDADHYNEIRRGAEDPTGLDLRPARMDRTAGEGTDQLLMVSQAPVIYLPNGQSGKLAVARVPDSFRNFSDRGRTALVNAARDWNVDQRQVGGELHPLFIANQRRGLRSGFDAGDLSPHAALLLGGGLYQRMFERRSVSTRRSYAVSVLVDGSASMLQPRRLSAPRDRRPWGLAAAMLGAWTLAAMCNELRVDFEVALFNRAFVAQVDDTEWTYSRRRAAAISELRQSHGAAADRLTSTVNHYVLSAFHEPWRRSDDLLAGLFWTAAHASEAGVEARRNPRRTPPVSLFEKGANVDELNVTYAAGRLVNHGARVRVLVVLADGMTRGSVEALARSVEEVDGRGTTVLGIGVGDDTVVSAYRHHQVISRPDDLANSMVAGVRMALRRGLALDGEDTWWIRAGRQQTASSPLMPELRSA